ncbi:hypothetical protein ARSEF1564_007215 [Beauveria bassiana]
MPWPEAGHRPMQAVIFASTAEEAKIFINEGVCTAGPFSKREPGQKAKKGRRR